MQFSFSAIRKRMEKDVDEVGKIARNVKAKIEAINKDVSLLKIVIEISSSIFFIILCYISSIN